MIKKRTYLFDERCSSLKANEYYKSFRIYKKRETVKRFFWILRNILKVTIVLSLSFFFFSHI